MSSRRIAPREWGHFLESFSARHLGVACRLEIDDVAAGIRVRATRMVFRGLIYEHEPGHAILVLEVFVGDPADTHMTRVHSTPGWVSVDEDEQGGVRALHIDGGRGVLTLHVEPAERAPARAES